MSSNLIVITYELLQISILLLQEHLLHVITSSECWDLTALVRVDSSVLLWLSSVSTLKMMFVQSKRQTWRRCRTQCEISDSWLLTTEQLIIHSVLKYVVLSTDDSCFTVLCAVIVKCYVFSFLTPADKNSYAHSVIIMKPNIWYTLYKLFVLLEMRQIFAS